MAVLGLEFLRYSNGQEKTRLEVDTADRHHEIMGRIARAGLVASDRYDEKKIFSEFFPVQTPDEGVDYTQVAWDQNVTFQAPGEDELALLQRMMADNAVTIPGASLISPEEEADLSLAVPDDAPVIEQIESDREWV